MNVALEQSAFLITADRDLNDQLRQSLSLHAIPFRSYLNLDLLDQNLTRDEHGCCLIDGRLNGVESVHSLISRASARMPSIILCDAGDVRTAVNSIKLGAFDAVERNTSHEALASKIANAFREDQDRISATFVRETGCGKVSSLTAREHELASLLCVGLSNKEIAARLDISIHTVANHRANLSSKLQTQNTADVVRTIMMNGCPSAPAAVTGRLQVLPPCLSRSANPQAA